MTGLDGVYALVDCDNTFFLGRKDHAVAYVDSDPTDPASAIAERDRWCKPDHIEGFFVGINITFDGWLVMTTDHGWVVLLKRDFSEYRAIQIRGGARCCGLLRAKAEDYGHTGFGWVRTSTCVDDDNSIYLSSCDHHHKVVWDGERLSIDEADGAWSFPYRNGAQNGSGTTPSLMGFGPDEITSSCSAMATRSSTSPTPGATRSPTTGSSCPVRRRAASLASVPPTWGPRPAGHPDGAVDHRFWLRRDDGQQRTGLDPRRHPAAREAAALLHAGSQA